MALTDAQKAEIRMFLGWTPRFGQADTALARALSAIATFPADEALITNAIDGNPPGILAALKDVDAKIIGSHSRLKADNVGTIKLNRAELRQLYADGTRLSARLARILGVEMRGSPFSTHKIRARATWYGQTLPRNYMAQG